MLTGLSDVNLYVYRFLYEQIKSGSKPDHGLCFMSPTGIMHHERKQRNQNIEDASRLISRRLSSRKEKDHIIILPYNPGFDFRHPLNFT
jgi:hypothetical protein